MSRVLRREAKQGSAWICEEEILNTVKGPPDASVELRYRAQRYSDAQLMWSPEFKPRRTKEKAASVVGREKSMRGSLGNY